jgi:hypothetical protein
MDEVHGVGTAHWQANRQSSPIAPTPRLAGESATYFNGDSGSGSVGDRSCSTQAALFAQPQGVGLTVTSSTSHSCNIIACYVGGCVNGGGVVGGAAAVPKSQNNVTPNCELPFKDAHNADSGGSVTGKSVKSHVSKIPPGRAAALSAAAAKKKKRICSSGRLHLQRSSHARTPRYA